MVCSKIPYTRHYLPIVGVFLFLKYPICCEDKLKYIQSGVNSLACLAVAGGYLFTSQQCYKKALIPTCELLFSTHEKPVEKNSSSVDMLMDHLELDRELTKTKEKNTSDSSWKEVHHILELVCKCSFISYIILKNKRKSPVLLKIYLFYKS